MSMTSYMSVDLTLFQDLDDIYIVLVQTLR